MLPKYLKLYHHRKHTRKHLPTVIEDLCHQFSLEDLRNSTNNFDLRPIIGRDRHKTDKTYKGCLEFNGVVDYAIVLKRLIEKYSVVEFKNEIEVLCQLNHPNLVSLIGFCDHKDEKILVYKYESSMSLDKHLLIENDHDQVIEPLSWKKRLQICIGIARGIHYLHSGTKRTFFHRDIKPENILLDNNMVPKLTGFGHSLKGAKFMSDQKTIEVDCIVGTLDYMAPEYTMYGAFTNKSDVYSFGMVLLIVVSEMTISTLFTEEALHSPFEESICSTLKGKIAPECWNVFVDLTKRCLNSDPNERPIIGEVEVELEHTLSLQEEADISNANANGYYTLLTTTTITGRRLDTAKIFNLLFHPRSTQNKV